MCGFVGYSLKDEPADEQIIQRMLHTISHRGPDGIGNYTDSWVSLSACRLAILDLNINGNQPMTSHDGRYVICFNGEIYNHKELRKKVSSDRVFTSKTDTETLLALFEQEGPSTSSRKYIR